jgi:sigma-B regulation protein RsbU (phosphoserine phosphatase)
VLATEGKSPHQILRELNAHLCEDNDACMFVTIGCGLLDVASGRVQYASAGHDAPLLRTADGDVRVLAVDNGPAIGIDTSAEYSVTETVLGAGDTLLLFTDGVTEAPTSDGSEFGAERLTALLREADDGSPDALVQRVVSTVADTARAFDDLTVLALSVHWLIEPEISQAGVAQAQQWLRSILAARDVIAARIGDAELIAEELLTNAVRSLAARRGSSRLSLECELTSAQIVMTVRDDGPPFDPLALVAPDLSVGIDDRAIGGLGIALVRELADDCRYSRVQGHNVMEVRLHRTLSDER